MFAGRWLGAPRRARFRALDPVRKACWKGRPTRSRTISLFRPDCSDFGVGKKGLQNYLNNRGFTSSLFMTAPQRGFHRTNRPFQQGRRLRGVSCPGSSPARRSSERGRPGCATRAPPAPGCFRYTALTSRGSWGTSLLRHLLRGDAARSTSTGTEEDAPMNDLRLAHPTRTNDVRNGPAPDDRLPRPAVPFSADALDALLGHLADLKTELLWLSCKWARRLRDEPAALSQVRRKVQAAFVRRGKRLLRQLLDALEDHPDGPVALAINDRAA